MGETLLPKKLALPHVGISSSRPTREAMATPFHWLNPTWANLVAQGPEPVVGEVLVRCLGLLDGQDIDLSTLQPRLEAVDPGSDEVDVPGRDAHHRTLWRRPRLG